MGPTIYNKLIYMYLKTNKDELGEEGFYSFLATHIMKQLIATQIVNEKSPWWDNVKLKKGIKIRDSFEILQRIVAVLENQLGKSVPLTWNKVHVVEYEHALGKVSLEEYLMWGHLKFQVLMK
jgi:penicillin amidase